MNMPRWLRALRKPPYATLLAASVAWTLPNLVDAKEIAHTRAIAQAAGAHYWDQFDTNGWWIGYGMSMRMMRGGRIQVALTIAADTNNYNIRTNAVLAPNWSSTGAVDVRVTINTTIWVGLSFVGAANAAMDTGGSWNNQTNLTLVNNGFLSSCGGDGGASNGVNGGRGGDALYLQYPISIDNSNGYIRGGGGAGGGGGQYDPGGLTITGPLSGGGGGGGIGNPGGAAGADSTGSGAPTAGSRTSGGAGNGGQFDSFYGVGGGGGGSCTFFGWATTGPSGNPSTDSHAGGVGGAAGRAIITNSNAVTWLGGNNGTQVVGAVI